MRSRFSLRARILFGAILWTSGLFIISGVVLTHLMYLHPQAPGVFHRIFLNFTLLTSIAVVCLVAGLFEVLADRTQAPDHELPDTGVGVQRERELSSIFVSGGRYGTRASTLILVHQDGSVLFVERSYGPLGVRLGEVAYRFDLQSITDPGPAVRPTAQQG